MRFVPSTNLCIYFKNYRRGQWSFVHKVYHTYMPSLWYRLGDSLEFSGLGARSLPFWQWKRRNILSYICLSSLYWDGAGWLPTNSGWCIQAGKFRIISPIPGALRFFLSSGHHDMALGLCGGHQWKIFLSCLLQWRHFSYVGCIDASHPRRFCGFNYEVPWPQESILCCSGSLCYHSFCLWRSFCDWYFLGGGRRPRMVLASRRDCLRRNVCSSEYQFSFLMCSVVTLLSLAYLPWSFTT